MHGRAGPSERPGPPATATAESPPGRAGAVSPLQAAPMTNRKPHKPGPIRRKNAEAAASPRWFGPPDPM